MRQGLSEPEFYGNLVYRLNNIVGSNNVLAQFIKIIPHYKKIGYNINVLQHTANTVGNFAFLFNLSGSDFRLFDSFDLKTYLLMRMCGPGALAVVRPTGVYLLDFFCSGIQYKVLLSLYLCLISFLYLDLYVLGDDDG